MQVHPMEFDGIQPPAPNESLVAHENLRWDAPRYNLKKLPPGTIIVATAETPRFNAFWASVIMLKEQYPQVSLRWSASVDICYNWNDALRRRPPWGEWVWFIGDDHTFEPNVIERLYTWNREVIVPLCLKRSFPHQTVLYGPNHTAWVPKPAQAGIAEVWAAGGAGMLVRESALSKIKQPWFEFLDTNDERAGEDLMLCKKFREAGVRIWVDLDTWIGHITPVEIWPIRNEQGAWGTQYRNVLKTNVV